MLNNTKILLVILGMAVVASPIIYLSSKYSGEKELNAQLNEVLNEALQDKESLQKYVSEIEKKINEQEIRLSGLSDVERIKNAFQSAQQFIDQLNKKISEIDKDRLTLQNKNTGLATRLESTGKELSRFQEELRLSRTEVTKLDAGQAGSLKRKIEELTRDNDFKKQDLSKLKEDLTRAQSASLALEEKNKELEKNIWDLQNQKGPAAQKMPNKEMQENIAQLKLTLVEKEDQIKELETELARLNSLPTKTAQRANKEQQKEIDNLEAANKELKRKISDFEEELNNAKSEVNRLKARKESPEVNNLYENARGQVSRLSELLLKKELEIESVKKESFALKEKLIGLQTRLSGLENEFSISKVDSEKVKELERNKLSLDSRLSELQETAAKKSELVSSLQRNLEYLTGQLAKKEEEIRSVESQYAQSDTLTREEVEKQKSRYEEMNMLYNSLKTQVAQFSEALNQKESEVEEKRREMVSLKEEAAVLKTRSENLDKDLLEAKERQKKTLDDLVAALRLNTALQEKIMGIAPIKGSTKPISEQQSKADELKRKVEVILEPVR